MRKNSPEKAEVYFLEIVLPTNSHFYDNHASKLKACLCFNATPSVSSASSSIPRAEFSALLTFAGVFQGSMT
jgi:hypothetical protein